MLKIRFMHALFVGLIAAHFGISTAQAASDPAKNGNSGFNPRQTFAPFFMPQSINRYRSASGRPGPDYWQNRANYSIRAKIDPQAKRLAGRETITYINHGPSALRALWLAMAQNRYRRNARANFDAGPHSPPANDHTRGMQLDSVEIEAGGRRYKARYQVSDTRLRIALARPLAGSGGRLKIHIRYHYTIPSARFGGRNGWASTPNGTIYEIAQWYPRVCVYDDIRGWNTAPFLNQEFYAEYGDFDYAVTVPADMIVAGAGRLSNPEQVLSDRSLSRLRRARRSEKTIVVRDLSAAKHQKTAPAKDATRTWRFKMHDTRDVAFAASRAFIWDAARVDLPGDRHALAMSYYPPNSAGRHAWGRSTQYLKASIEDFSRRWAVYPYATAVAVGGPVGGMEYPGLAFDSQRATGRDLFMITAHEIGHSWFPMWVGSDERRHAWMDEGMNTFIDTFAQADFNDGEFGPKRDSEYAPAGGNPVDGIVPLLKDPNAPPILTRADLIPEKYRHPVTYYKTALGLKLLRSQILGPKRFDAAFRQYIADWSGRHPQPSDFFRTMDSAAGEDLSWFWRGWFAHNWRLDLAVLKIRRDKTNTDDGKPDGVMVTVANNDRLVMPATLRVTYVDGSHADRRIPVATWMQRARFEVRVGTGTKQVVKATIDPEHVVPDVDRSNNAMRLTSSRPNSTTSFFDDRDKKFTPAKNKYIAPGYLSWLQPISTSIERNAVKYK